MIGDMVRFQRATGPIPGMGEIAHSNDAAHDERRWNVLKNALLDTLLIDLLEQLVVFLLSPRDDLLLSVGQLALVAEVDGRPGPAIHDVERVLPYHSRKHGIRRIVGL